MKNFKLFITTSFILLFFVSFGYSQTYTLSGSQTKGVAGSNAKLECNPVKITKNVKIISISGSNNGFWISKDGVTVKTFWKPNDPSAKGLLLKPGNYWIYPNLKQNQSKATVTIKLQ